MKIQTHAPFIPEPQKITSEISQFWDTVSLGWQKIIGPHIHHGYYESEGLHNSPYSNNRETDIHAQEKLIQKIAALLNINSTSKILDVGCGMGGSSIFLAQNYGANVTGISISAQQIALASKAVPENLKNSVAFKIEDAHSLAAFPNSHFDIVWSLESCEQFYDKSLFIQQAMRVLKPNGKLMVATWCSDAEQYQGEKAKIYQSLCKSFQLPYMPTIAHYSEIMKKYGNLIFVEDWSDNVKYSWDFGIQKVKSYSWLNLFKMGGLIGLKFILKLRLMSTAFKNGQLRYGVFVLRK